MAKTAEEQLGVSLAEDDAQAELQAAQPAEAPPAAPERPDWLPENFDTPEAMASSYREAQSKIREQGTALNQMEQRLAELEQQRTYESAEQGPSPSEFRDQLDTMYENDPIQAINYLAQLQAQQTVQAELQQFQQTHFAQQTPMQSAQAELLAAQADYALGQEYADWNQMKDKVGEVLMADPDLLSGPDAQTLSGATKGFDRAYKLAKYAQLEADIAAGKPIQAYEAGAPVGASAPASQQFQPQQPMLPQSELARVMKMRSQLAPGGSGRPDTADPTEEWASRMTHALRGSSWSAHRNG